MPCNVSACCRAPVERDVRSTKLYHLNDDETGVDAVQRPSLFRAPVERKAEYVYTAHSKRPPLGGYTAPAAKAAEGTEGEPTVFFMYE